MIVGKILMSSPDHSQGSIPFPRQTLSLYSPFADEYTPRYHKLFKEKPRVHRCALVY